MKRILIAMAVLILLVGCGGKVAGEDKDATRLTFAAVASFDNSAGVSTGTYGYADTGYCWFTTTGTGIKNITLQSSATATGFTNATSTQALKPTDTDSLAFDLRGKAGLYWRIHAEDAGVNVTNAVTAKCDLWLN